MSIEARPSGVPYGCCWCGCGGQTTIATRNDPRWGHIKGEPKRWLKGHHTRKSGTDYVVDEATGCWLWQRAINARTGYAQVYVPGDRTPRLAHRVYYERYVGPIPHGMAVDHVRARGCAHAHCVNPAHLEAVSQQENIHRSRVTKLTQADVDRIRASSRSNSQIAAEYGIDPSQVSRIRTRRRWTS